MLRFLYVCLLRLHPRHFRQRFAAEMLWIFDEAQSAGPLFADVVKSLARQWVLRSDVAEQPAQVFDGVPRFYTCESSGPRPAALINGGVLAFAVFAALALAIVHGGGRIVAASWSGSGYGSPRDARVLTATSSGTYDSLNPTLWAEVKEFFAGFVHAQPAVAAEPPKSASAPAAPPQLELQLLAVQDALSPAELQNAKVVLRRVIVSGDCKPGPGEVMPDPVASYAGIVFTLDKDGDGRISRAERTSELREFLDRADRDRDGFVTRQELKNEIRRRADANQDGVVTWEELETAIRSGALKWPTTVN